jgi:dephospho-CoA kinase
MTRIIGLTGGIGSGKSAVTDELLRRGYTVLDADVISREVTGRGSAALAELAELFGSGVIGADGALDRKAVSDTIFASPENMGRFNRVMRDAIGARLDAGIAEYRADEARRGADGKPLFLSAALLYEAGWDSKCDEVWLVTADDALRTRRAAARDGVAEGRIRERMAFQTPESAKRGKADAVIENNGTTTELLDMLDKLLFDSGARRDKDWI